MHNHNTDYVHICREFSLMKIAERPTRKRRVQDVMMAWIGIHD